MDKRKVQEKISKSNKRARRIICQMNQNFGNVNEQRSNEINQITTPLRARASQSNIYTMPQVTQSQETILESFMPSSSSANCDRKRNSLICSNYFFSKIKKTFDTIATIIFYVLSTSFIGSNVNTTLHPTQYQENILESFVPLSSGNCDRPRNSLINFNYFFPKLKKTI